MVFEQAKQNFETKTNQAPKKVEGNWKDFTNQAKLYLTKKQREVSGFINKLNYPGKEKDKGEYLASMDRAIDDVIDGNEATKNEMTKYNGLLYKKSNELKNKLLQERHAMEVRETENELQSTVEAFRDIGLSLNISDNVKTYLSLAKTKRIPLKKINLAMQQIVENAYILRIGDIQKHKNLFYTIFNHYCWGNLDAAKKETQRLKEHIDFFKKCKDIREKTGLQIGNKGLNTIMSALIKTGVKKETVDIFIVKNVEKLKKLDPKNFEQLTKNLNQNSLVKFLLTSIIAVSEGKTLKAVDAIKMTLQMESTLLNQQKEAVNKLKKIPARIKETTNELREYQKKHPHVTIDKKIALLQRNIAVLVNNATWYRKELVLISAKRSLANSFLSMKRMNPSSTSSKKTMAEILKAKDSEKLERLAVDNCGVAEIPQLQLLRAQELQFGMAQEDVQVKNWYERNPMIDNPLNLHDVLNRFYKTGKLSFGARRAIREQTTHQSAKLEDLVFDNLDNEQDGFDSFKKITKKYKTISDIPKEEARDILVKLSGYLTLVKSMHSAALKFIGNAQMLKILSPDDEKITKKIGEMKKRVRYFANNINAVSKFMGMKQDPSLNNTDALINSPLFAPLIQKEISPHLQKMEKDMEKIQDAARPIPYIGKIIEKQAKQNPQFVVLRFDEGIEKIKYLKETMVSARNDAIDIKKQIEASLDDPAKTKGLPQSMILQRKRYLKNVLKKLDIALNSPKSPLSLAAIKKVEQQVNEVKKSRDRYIKEGAWKGIATTLIMAAAIATAVGGGLAAGALSAQLFGATAATGFSFASVASTTMSMTGVAAGSVVGSRLVMQGFDSLGLVNFGGAKHIWEPKSMGKNFALAFALSLAAVGSAKFIMNTLEKVAVSESMAIRFPGLVKFSRGALVKMKGLSKFTSPKKLLSGEENVNPSTFLKYFGEKVGEEIGEEMVENTAGKINPVLEFLVSVANSADGVDAKLSMHGIKGANIGVTTEGRSMVYTTKTPQEFVANLKTELDIKPGVEFKATINPDNSVTLDILSMDIDPATGAKKQRISTTIKIHPAQLSTNISSDVEITRIQGLQATKGKPGEYTFTDSEHSMSVFANLYSRGFNITKQSDNSFKVSKGDTVFTLKASDSVIGTNRAKLATWITNPAFKKFLELNGNYRKLLKKYPKLAKLFPKDLLKLKVIPVPVMALACGLPMNLKSIQELALGTPKTSAQLGSLVTESNLVNSSTTEQTLDLIGIKSNRELIRTTYFDSATGLMNRNGLILGEKLLRQGGTLSIANFDADHFRASNEIISRSYGDAQIQIIAKNINHAILKLRKAGYKAYAIRMGGEEFTIMTTAPKEILHKTVVEMSANAKKEVLSTLSEEQKKVMSEHIAKTKYADDPNGIAKARSELGGISGSIIRIDGKALDHQKSDIKKALMYADSSMEGLKRINGRGHFDLDHRSSKETSQRVNTFEIDNVLDSAQKTNLGKEAKRLFSRATNQFNSRLNLLNSVIKKSSPSEQKTFFKELKYVLSSPDSRIQEIANVLKKYGANPSIAQKLKTEYITALKSYGTYTGARTMQSYLSKTGKIFPRFREANGWKIEIGKFKSINETLGHVGGDAFLTFVYQDVIIPTTKKMGIRVEGSNPDLIISQKGADFYFCFSNKFLLNHPGIETQFQNAMNKQYKTSYHSFITRITGNGKSYQAKRDKWLGDNEQSNPNSLIEQYNLYFHKT